MSYDSLHTEDAMTQEQVQWFCQPTKSGSPTPRKWLLRYDDAEVGDCYFDNEAEAYAAFERANIGYSCWLFATVPTRTGEAPWVSTALASAQQEPSPSADAEATALLKRFAEYLVPAYLENRCLIAQLCDEQLDGSGALLGYLREAAARAKPSENSGAR